jgi:isopenicillin-N epimerase
MEDRLQPLVVSWGYKANQYPISDAAGPSGPDDRDVYGSTPRTRFLEFDGTRDVCSWLAIPDAIDFQQLLGFDAIRQRMAELAAYTRGVIPLSLATPAVPALHGAMTAFELPPGKTAAEWRKELWDHRIEAPVIERPDRLLIRVSHHFYTTEAEVDVLAAFLAIGHRQVAGASVT